MVANVMVVFKESSVFEIWPTKANASIRFLRFTKWSTKWCIINQRHILGVIITCLKSVISNSMSEVARDYAMESLMELSAFAEMTAKQVSFLRLLKATTCSTWWLCMQACILFR